MSPFDFSRQFFYRSQNVEPTLNVRFSGGRSIVFIVLLVLAFFTIGEGLVRLNADSFILGVPSIGSSDRIFESRLSLLDTYAAGRDSIDCVMFGDSTVMTDFAPYPFQDSFFEVTGERIECFNFGVGAFSLVDMAALAQIVAEDYSPGFIIVGVEALNFTVPSLDQVGHDFGELRWTQYKLGRFTLEGWLYDHSHLYRHLGAVQKLVKMENSPVEMERITTQAYNTYRNGFYQLDGPPELDMSQPPDPASDHRYHVAYFDFHSNYQLLPEHLTALEQIVALNSPETQVIIVEMPVPDTFFYYFDNGKQDYDLFIKAVEESVDNASVPFWTTTDLQLVPYDLWHNYNHLTEEGAPIFSEWLGRRMGQAVLDGTVQFHGGSKEKGNGN